MEWYRQRNKFKSRSGGYTPKVGDTVFFWNTSAGRVGHTGIVTEVTDSMVTTIEGNASDGVHSRIYNRTNIYIHGYGDNGGVQTVTPEEPEEEEINDAILKKAVSFLRASNVPVKYNAST